MLNAFIEEGSENQDPQIPYTPLKQNGVLLSQLSAVRNMTE